MAEVDTLRLKTVFHILGLCFTWYSVSSGNNIIGKIILNDFPYPMTVSMCQLLSISVYLYPLMVVWGVPTSSLNLKTRYWIVMILPLAFGKFFSSVSSHISLWKVPVSYAHTVKATMPLFTVLLSRILLREKQTLQVYLSLTPIIAGVTIATVTEISFDLIGLITALTATFGFALQTIFSKKCLHDTGMHQFRLLFLISVISCSAFFPLWFWNDATAIWSDNGLWNSPHVSRLLALLVIDGFCNFIQNIIAFTLISMISPLSYAVANATKRISIVSLSLIFLKNPVTTVNICGMMLAILGVLLYNKAKYDQARSKWRLVPVKSEVEIGGLNGASKHLSSSTNGIRAVHSSLLLDSHTDTSPMTIVGTQQDGGIAITMPSNMSNGHVANGHAANGHALNGYTSASRNGDVSQNNSHNATDHGGRTTHRQGTHVIDL